MPPGLLFEGSLEAFDFITKIKPDISKLPLPQAISQDSVLEKCEKHKKVVKKVKKVPHSNGIRYFYSCGGRI